MYSYGIRAEESRVTNSAFFLSDPATTFWYNLHRSNHETTYFQRVDLLEIAYPEAPKQPIDRIHSRAVGSHS